MPHSPITIPEVCDSPAFRVGKLVVACSSTLKICGGNLILRCLLSTQEYQYLHSQKVSAARPAIQTEFSLILPCSVGDRMLLFTLVRTAKKKKTTEYE
jgi:hypothetical protein